MEWKDDALKAVKDYYESDDFEYSYEYLNGIEFEYVGDDPDIHNYLVFKDKKSAYNAAIESEKELLDDVFDIKHMKKFIDVDDCYNLKPYMVNVMAEDIIMYNPDYDIFDIIEKLKDDPFKTLEEYSELYIWHNEEHSVFDIDLYKCAKKIVDKYGVANILDNYYSYNEDVLPGGFYSYPRG